MIERIFKSKPADHESIGLYALALSQELSDVFDKEVLKRLTDEAFNHLCGLIDQEGERRIGLHTHGNN